jgi:endonuclease-3 related protein
MRPPPIQRIYRDLYAAWGPRGWWPAETDLEMMVGAILTQNTAWTNVEKAIERLKQAGALRFRPLHEAPIDELAGWIRPAGYFNVKARRLRALTTLVAGPYQGEVRRLLTEPPERLRAVLLGVNGVGPETADSIVLYAAGQPVFVVDAYTRRFLRRHGWIRGDESYDEVAAVFTGVLPGRAPLFNEYHALIVELGKKHCRARPDCASCPLRSLLPRGGPVGDRHIS